MNIKSDITWRIVVCYAAMVVFGMAIIYQVLHIQIAEGKYWRSKEDSATLKYINISAERGNIYSEDGRLIATSLPTFEVHFDAQADGLTDELFDSKVDSLSVLMNKEFPVKSIIEYRHLMVNARRNGERYQLLLKDISYPQLLAVKRWPLFRLGQNRGGLLVKQIDKRLYPYDNLALRTIGYVKDNSPIAVGIEAAYNNDLTGIPGKQLMRKISSGVYMPLNNNFLVEPKNGKDIITTLDVSLQDEAEHALEKTLEANNADHGCVIVMEVKTGKIKALANLGKKADGTYEEIFNFAIGENREPGSTFKTASILALLEDGYIRLNDTIDVEAGVHKYGKQVMKDAEEHGFRKISVMKAFAISSNVGISKLVTKYYEHQPERYLQHLHAWHLDQSLGIEIPGEAAPTIKNTTNKYWSTFSLPWMSVGYELKVSPLNICTLYNAIANDGVMVKPYLVSEVDEYGKPIKKYTTTILNKKICSDSTLKRARKMLEAVVNYGTATGLKNPYYSIAGKTGTAMITEGLKKDTAKRNREYQSSFCGFFPADNPIYTICVVINRPSKGVYYGAKVAGPVFKDIADKVYANASLMQMTDTIVNTHDKHSKELLCKGYKSDLNTISKYIHIPVTDSSNGEWANSSELDNNVILKPMAIGATVIPDVKGMGLRDALYVLENAGLAVQVMGSGIVKQQSLRAGQVFKKGQVIIITLI